MNLVIPKEIVSRLGAKESVILTKIVTTSINNGYSTASDEFLSKIINGSKINEISYTIDDLLRKSVIYQYEEINDHNRILLLDSSIYDIYKKHCANLVAPNSPSNYVLNDHRVKSNGILIPFEIKVSINYVYIPLLSMIVNYSINNGYCTFDQVKEIVRKLKIINQKEILKELVSNNTIICYSSNKSNFIFTPTNWTRNIYKNHDINIPNFSVPYDYEIYHGNIEHTHTPTIYNRSINNFKDNLKIPVEIQEEVNYRYWVPFVQMVSSANKTGRTIIKRILNIVNGINSKDNIEFIKYLYDNGWINIYSKFFNKSQRYSFNVTFTSKTEKIYQKYSDLYIHRPWSNKSDPLCKKIDFNEMMILREMNGDE